MSPQWDSEVQVEPSSVKVVWVGGLRGTQVIDKGSDGLLGPSPPLRATGWSVCIGCGNLWPVLRVRRGRPLEGSEPHRTEARVPVTLPRASGVLNEGRSSAR